MWNFYFPLYLLLTRINKHGVFFPYDLMCLYNLRTGNGNLQRQQQHIPSSAIRDRDRYPGTRASARVLSSTLYTCLLSNFCLLRDFFLCSLLWNILSRAWTPGATLITIPAVLKFPREKKFVFINVWFWLAIFFFSPYDSMCLSVLLSIRIL